MRRQILALMLAFLAVVVTAGGLAISRAGPILRARVIDTLSTRFKSRVELDVFHVSISRGLEVSGKGLRIFGETDPNSHQPGIQPLIAVAEFRFRSGIWGLFRSPMEVRTVYLKGLQLNLPPKEQRAQMSRMKPKGEKIEIVVDSLIADTAELVINTEKPGKLPLDFAIERLKMTRIGPDQPMHFEADLINPKPVGKIHSSGSFGPWQADSPWDTPVQGHYAFRDADLSTIKGIGGILSSTGNYSGKLDHIAVDGTTDTPDFHIAISGRPVPLHTDFHAIVDGTSGDTYLQPVRAKLQDSWLTASGFVVRNREAPGHHVKLTVEIKQGRIEDLLKLAVRTDPPVMTGSVQLKTDFDLPPGEPDLANRLKLAGTFRIVAVHFTNAGIQAKVDSLSMRSEGKPKLAQDNIPDNVHSELSGTFRLSQGLISFSELQFQVPGALIDLAGKYSLDGNQVDFHGKARMDAKLSQMVTGWKSVLLKPVDPFFRKDGAGTEIPVKVTGTKSDLHLGTDFGHNSSNRD
ncbi:MAG: AsmA-like C-terminal region-containing protein [Terriglobales bacterium]